MGNEEYHNSSAFPKKAPQKRLEKPPGKGGYPAFGWVGCGVDPNPSHER
jgi:hypothetical protein